MANHAEPAGMSISPAEQTKLDSRRLRGSLLESLADPVTAALHESDQSLIKYHGSYQQDNRDVREKRRLAKLERSEEHTSELQALMRISYAVFCLKNKTQKNKQN